MQFQDYQIFRAIINFWAFSLLPFYFYCGFTLPRLTFNDLNPIPKDNFHDRDMKGWRGLFKKYPCLLFVNFFSFQLDKKYQLNYVTGQRRTFISQPYINRGLCGRNSYYFERR
jgi:hypothetical protein